MIKNIIIQEAVEKAFNPTDIIKEIKKCMATCRLTTFKSQPECANLYSKFFLCNVETTDVITADQWGIIYSTLMSDNTFSNNMCYYLMMYKPDNTSGMFKPFMALVTSEVREMTSKKVKYLSGIKASVNMLYKQFDAIRELVSKQVNDPSAYYFITTVLSVINSMGFQINDMMQDELTKDADPNDVSYPVDQNQPLEEDVQEFLALLENGDAYIKNEINTMLSENIINDAKEKAKAIFIKEKKAEDEFNRICMKKVKEMRETRRNKKHAEMVGEALRVNREIKRILVSAGAGLINPAIGVIVWLTSFFYDRSTDAGDRAILIQQLKDEIEIIDEKISMAERNGDDKAKIELMRAKQKLLFEYKRITKLRYDPNARK